MVVLYAEDSDDDAFLMKRTFKKVQFPGSLVVVPDGDEAVNYLAGQGQYADRSPNPQPSLILLDVKMPNRDGLAVLTWIRNSVISSNIPVIMLTSSSQQIDVSTAYETGADCYLVKPANLDRFRDLVEDLMKVCWPEPAQPQCLFEVRFPNHSERRAFRKD